MSRIYRLSIMVMAVVTLGGCGLYKTYERQEMPFVDSLYRRMDAPVDSVSTASVSWDSMFTDPLLQKWIRMGLEHNTDLKVAQTRVKEAEASLISARWALLPGAGFNAQGNVPGNFSANVTASWEADIFGSPAKFRV